jgi:ABC-type transport system involved in cytochrome bd biosynthesis fused ATPase/permease subunit
MRNIATQVFLSIVLSIVCIAAAITLLFSAISQSAIASNVEIVQQTTESPSLKLLGVLGANRSYRFTINRPEDLMYL